MVSILDEIIQSLINRHEVTVAYKGNGSSETGIVSSLMWKEDGSNNPIPSGPAGLCFSIGRTRWLLSHISSVKSVERVGVNHE